MSKIPLMIKSISTMPNSKYYATHEKLKIYEIKACILGLSGEVVLHEPIKNVLKMCNVRVGKLEELGNHVMIHNNDDKIVTTQAEIFKQLRANNKTYKVLRKKYHDPRYFTCGIAKNKCSQLSYLWQFNTTFYK